MKLLILTTTFLTHATIFGDSKKIWLDPELGKSIVETVRKSAGNNSTTSCRREQKNVIHNSLFYPLISHLHKYSLKSRDSDPTGGKNSTLTFYSKGASFLNEGIRTNIRCRIRFYLQVFRTFNVDQSCPNHWTRSPLTANSGILEIKIKNPSAKELNGVLKIRMLISDELLNSLLINKKDALSDLYVHSLQNKSFNKKSQSYGVLSVLAKILDVSPEILDFKYAVSYERNSFKITEAPYVPRSVIPYPIPEKMDYEITVDSNIRYHLPNLSYNDGLNILEFPQGLHLKGNYPKDAMALEFKDPYPMASLPKESLSQIHSDLLLCLVTDLQTCENSYLKFASNKGKAANYKRIVK